MPVPERFRLKPIPQPMMDRFSKLCDAIVEADSDDEARLLREWNRHATAWEYDRSDFEMYSSSMSKEEFIRKALLPKPTLVHDVTYDELSTILNAVALAEFDDQADHDYYVNWLEANLPGGDISDLIYWPNLWFGDDSLFLDENHHFKPESELTNDQILRYAMLKSGRVFDDAPNVDLPFPLPE